MIHKLKIDRVFFEAALNDKKKFEIRYNDRNYQVGDTIVLQEINDERQYTGRKIFGEITFITSYEQKDGYVVFSFNKL